MRLLAELVHACLLQTEGRGIKKLEGAGVGVLGVSGWGGGGEEGLSTGFSRREEAGRKEKSQRNSLFKWPELVVLAWRPPQGGAAGGRRWRN